MQELTQKIIEIKESALIEMAPPYEQVIQELLDNCPINTQISVPYHLFRQIQIPEKFSKVDSPRNYLSLKRLEEFENREFFENHEISALLKYLIWKEQTKTGLLSEVGLFGQEKQTIHYVNIDESCSNLEEEILYSNALKKDAQSPSLCSHQYLIDKPASAEKIDKELIIIDLENFIQSLRYNLSSYIKLDFSLAILNELLTKQPGNPTIETLVSKATILFGIAGILFDKGNDQNIFAPRSTINQETFASKEWQDLSKSVQNLIEISMELSEILSPATTGSLTKWKNHLKQLQDFFATPNLQTHYSWLEKDPQGNVVLRKIPYSIKEKLNEILNQYGSYKIISENLDLIDDGKFIRQISGLPENLLLYKFPPKSENLEIILVKDSNESDKNQVPNFLETYLQQSTEKCAMVFTAKQNLEFVTLKLSQNNVPTISQLTGSSGKIQEQFKEATDNPLLLATPNLWENLEIANQIDTLFIHKLPFDPPSDPQLMAQSRLYENPFKELQVPRAIFALKKIIHRLDNTKPKKVVIFDQRILTKEYGNQFIQNLEQIGLVKTSKLKDI